MVANVKIMVVWDVVPCSLVDRYQHFGETWCFHVEDGRARAVHFDPPTVNLNMLLEGASLVPFEEVISWLEEAIEVLQEKAAEEVEQVGNCQDPERFLLAQEQSDQS
jgi:hypothetical protein